MATADNWREYPGDHLEGTSCCNCERRRQHMVLLVIVALLATCLWQCGTTTEEAIRQWHRAADSRA